MVSEAPRTAWQRVRRFSRFPLRAVLISTFVLQAVLAVGMVGYLSFRNGRSAVGEVIRNLHEETGARIEEHLLRFLDTPQLINRLNVNAIQQGLVSIGDSGQLERYLWEQVRVFPSVSSIYFGNTDGGLVDAGREGADGELYVIATDEFESGTFRKYATDVEGHRMELLQSVPGFDARTRTWYTAAVEQGGATWSDVYVLYSGQGMAISASRPVYSDNGDLLGVVASDLFLSQIGAFLADLEIGKTGVGFIVERSGQLVASSSDPSVQPGSEGPDSDRTSARASADPVIREAASHVVDAFGSFESVDGLWLSSFAIDGDLYTMQLEPLTGGVGTDWIVATVIPESDFMAQINENTRTTIYLVIAATLVAILASVLLSERITRPIVRLRASAEALASGTWKPVTSHNRIREVGELASSLNTMASTLEETVARLKREIEQHRNTEAELRSSEERYSLLANHVTDVIWTMDDQGRFTYISPSVEGMLGYSAAEVLASPISILLVSDAMRTVEHGLARLREALVTGATIELAETFELEQITKDGSRLWTETAISAMHDEQGRFMGIVGVSRDITARRKAAQERLAIEAQLRQGQRLESIGTLASGIAHEINNPLTGIINYADIIERRAQDERLKELAGEIMHEGKRVAEIVRRLLAFARQDTGEYHAEQVPGLVNSCLRLLEPAFKRSHVRVVRQIPDDLPSIMCHGQQIEQVFINLLTNARDALNARYPGPDDRKQIRISCEAIDRDGHPWLRTTVEDAGPGIEADVIDHVFDPFFTTKPRYEGTGLGLSVSYGIVREHEGDLLVESESGVGTRFYVDLPIRLD